MEFDLTLELADLRPVRIRDLEQSALCLSYDKRRIHILVDHQEDDSRAVLLNGEHAFHSYGIEAVHNSKAIAITEYGIIVDVSSACDTENQWPPLGAITIGAEGVKLQVAVSAGYGFTDKMGLKLGIEAQKVAPGISATFKRWAFKLGDPDRPQFIWIDAEKIKQD